MTNQQCVALIAVQLFVDRTGAYDFPEAVERAVDIFHLSGRALEEAKYNPDYAGFMLDERGK